MVVAQIRAITEADDTLETLPVKLSLDTIMKAAYWIDLEQSASWNKKLAKCLRNSGHVTKPISFFERALELDYDYVRARTGLASAYEDQGFFRKVIDLELTNTKILTRHLKNETEGEQNAHSQTGFS
jgi:tetratricopeptide (TPR) repeat protein